MKITRKNNKVVSLNIVSKGQTFIYSDYNDDVYMLVLEQMTSNPKVVNLHTGCMFPPDDLAKPVIIVELEAIEV